MQLKDTKLLNLLRRLRGWAPGSYRMMAEAKDGGGHFFGVYEIRGATHSEAETALRAYLAERECALIEVADVQAAHVPFPREVRVIQLSDRVYFGDTAPLPERVR